MTLLAVLLGLFVLTYLTIGAAVLRRPLIGRIAVREASRRPGQTAVLVLGLMIAGAAIFSVQVVFDSMYETNRAQVLRNWGRDDIEVSAGGAYFDGAMAQRITTDRAVCSCIAGIQNAIVTSGSVVDVTREAGRPNVQISGLDIAAERRFGAFVLADGRSTVGDELNSGDVFVTQPLADALGAQRGDRLRVIAGGASSVDLMVAGIVQREGAGAYGFDLSMFASLKTVQQVEGGDGVNLIRVSARGNGDTEVAGARGLADAIRGYFAANHLSMQVLEVKRGALDILDQASSSGRSFVTSFGMIIALAATALVANLAVMLSEERRPRLAVLRAMGLTRTGLVQLAVTEGAIYSLLGAIAGLPIGFAIVYILFSGAPRSAGASPMFAVHPESLLGAVAAAALLNLVTVLLASLRTTRMAISSAIRDLPEPPDTKRPSWKRSVFLAGLALAGVAAMLSGHLEYGLLGGALIIGAAAGFLRGRISDRWRYSAAGAAAVVWAVVDFQFIAAKVGTSLPFTFAVVVSVPALSILVAANLPLLDTAVGLAGRASGRLRATLRPTLAYASRRPLRSGLVIAAIAVVMAVLTLIQSLLSVPHDYRVFSGGWEVQAIVSGTDQLAVPDSLQSEVAQQSEFPSRTFLGPVNWVYTDFRGTSGWHQEPVTVFGLSPQQLESGMGFGNPADWAAIARDPNLVASTASVGSVVHLATGNGTVSFRVVATIPPTNMTTSLSSVIPGVIASRQALAELGNSAPGAMLLLKAAPGTSAGALAKDLQRATLPLGVDVSTTQSLVEQDDAAGGGAADFITWLLRIGLAVGVLSLGAVALRAVIERRRPIGVLRAMGYQPGQVLVGMLTETAALATAGMAVGLAVAYALGGTFIATFVNRSRFSPDVGSLALTIAVVYAAVLLVTVLPALRAARLRPAEALRVMG
jgi:ABC-type antimicrobial peptide transport system permease subunit